MDLSDLSVDAIVQSGNRRSLIKIIKIYNDNMIIGETVYSRTSPLRAVGRRRVYTADDVKAWRAPGEGMLAAYQKTLEE